MANIKSKKKNIKRIAIQTERNRSVKSTLKTLAKKVATLAAAGDSKEVKAAAIQYVSALDKAAKCNVLHVNKTNRYKKAVSKYIFEAAA